MLTNKDYCDYETCVALRDVKCKIETEWYIHQPSYKRGSCYLCFGIPRETSINDKCDYIPRLSLYETQKWLREEKKIEVLALSKGMVGVPYNAQVYTEDYVIQEGIEYNSYEEALLEGIKEAIKILKENETIHE